MDFTFSDMTREYALDIFQWKYEAPYDFYNNEVSEENICEMLSGSCSVCTDEKEKWPGSYVWGNLPKCLQDINLERTVMVWI